MLLTGILLGLFILVLLVVVHELGHGIVARRNGVVVEEFGVGFPPKAWGKKIANSVLGKNVLYTVNWLPLGGFVRLQGEHDAASAKGDYGAASYWVKTKILLAGVAMNWIVAAILLTLIAPFGIPEIMPGQFAMPGDTQAIKGPVQAALVEPGSPAEKAGLKARDELLVIDGQTLDDAAIVPKITEANKGKTVQLTYRSNGVTKSTNVQLRADNSDKKGYIGIATAQRNELKSTWSAPIVGVINTAQFTWFSLAETGKVAASAVSGAFQSLSSDSSTRQRGGEQLEVVGQSVAGPVGLLGVIFPGIQQAGFKIIVFFAAIVSLGLAVMNALPIPALDGGRWFTMTVYRLRRKPLTREREEQIQTVGFFALMALFVLITFADIGKFGQ